MPAHAHPYGNLLANGNGTYSHPTVPPLVHSQSLGTPSTAPAVVETVHLYVPSTAIGAIIGTKGLFIKSIIKNSNASVKVRMLHTPLTDRSWTHKLHSVLDQLDWCQ